MPLPPSKLFLFAIGLHHSWKKYRPSKITFLDKSSRSWTKQWKIGEVKFKRGLLGEPITEIWISFRFKLNCTSRWKFSRLQIVLSLSSVVERLYSLVIWWYVWSPPNWSQSVPRRRALQRQLSYMVLESFAPATNSNIWRGSNQVLDPHGGSEVGHTASFKWNRKQKVKVGRAQHLISVLCGLYTMQSPDVVKLALGWTIEYKP